MRLDQHMYGSADWHPPSPSSTPKSMTFPDASFETPKTDAVPQSSFLEAWSTPPGVNGHHTPAQTPSISLSTPVGRPSTASNHKIRSPEDPDFHVHYLVSSSLPLPPVDPSRRLSSSPSPLSAAGSTGATLRENPSSRSRPVSMDTSQMRTPPPTRDSSSRRNVNQSAANEQATPATVIARSPFHTQPGDTLFNQTPFGFPSLRLSPDAVQFPSPGQLPAPPLPHSRLFWDQSEMNTMDVDIPLASDPFGPSPYKIQRNVSWHTFNTPASQMNPESFQALHGTSSPGNCTSFAARSAAPSGNIASRSSSSISTSVGVDPSMLFSFSSPGPKTSFGGFSQPVAEQETRQPYEMQSLHSMREREEREMAKKAKNHYARTSTSSAASFENTRPPLQRSFTDSGFHKNRPSSVGSKSSSSAPGCSIPRRSSPLKRQSGGSLTSIPEARRPKTRLVIDANGLARTETISVEEDMPPRRDTYREPPTSIRQQYPELYDDADSDSDTDGEPIVLSRTSSFTMPQRRSSKHARTDSGGLERTTSLKMPRPSSGFFAKSSPDSVRLGIKPTDGSPRRFSMMDFSSFQIAKKPEDHNMADSPGDALGALKKVVVEGRKKRLERSAQDTLKAHNQRWSDMGSGSSPRGNYDPFGNSFGGSPATNTDAGFTTPSTDRSSISNESTRCVCNSTEDIRPMLQCESCNKWSHMACVGYNPHTLPPVYVCVFCTGQTPVARGGRVRGPLPSFDSPLTHKSVFRR